MMTMRELMTVGGAINKGVMVMWWVVVMSGWLAVEFVLVVL